MTANPHIANAEHSPTSSTRPTSSRSTAFSEGNTEAMTDQAKLTADDWIAVATQIAERLDLK